MAQTDPQPFTAQFQRELLVILLKDSAAYSRFLDIWKPSYFDDVNHRKIVEAYIKVRVGGGAHPTDVILKQELLSGVEDVRGPLPMDKQAQLDEVDELYKAQPQKQNYPLEKLRKFAKTQAVVASLGSAIECVHAGEPDKALTLMETACRVGTDMKEQGITVTSQTRSPGQSLVQQLVKGGIPTGLSTLDGVMSGGFRKGEMTTIVGGPGMFKSGMMLNWTFPALKQPHGKNVTYISLEMPEIQVWGRYCYRITRQTQKKLEEEWNNTGATVGFDNAFNREILNYCGRLHIKNFGSGTLDIASLRAYIDHLAGIGHETELLVVDYPQIMKKDPHERSDFVAIGDLYCGVRGLATEYNIPVIAAAQLNRDALKNPENIGLAQISATMDIARHSDYVHAIIQTEDMHKANNMRLKVIKNRNEVTGMQIDLLLEYGTYHVTDRGEWKTPTSNAAQANSTASNQNSQLRAARTNLANRVTVLSNLKIKSP